MKEAGADALTLRAAARSAGVTHAATYRHFPSKDALLAAVAEEGFRSLGRAMRRGSPSSGRPVERLVALAVAYVGFARRETASFRLMLGPGAPSKADYPSLESAARATFATLVEAIQELQAGGHMRPCEPTRLAMTAWATMHGLASLVVDTRVMKLKFPGLDPRTLTRRVVEDLFRGVGLSNHPAPRSERD